MRKNKVGSVSIVGIVAILCIASSAGATYFLVGQIKQSEIDNLKSNYNSEKNQYETEITDLNTQIGGLEKILNEDNQKYVKQMVNGLKAYSNGDYYLGLAMGYYIEASDYYDLNSFYTAFLYYYFASIYHQDSSNNYSSAEMFFDEAKENASNNKTRKIAETYSSLSDVNAVAFSEASKAYEDLSEACWYYNENDYTTGGFYYELYSEHFETYNDLLEPVLGLEDELTLILENFELLNE